MTTIVNPAGTPTVVSRDQATTVCTVAAAGNSGATATPLTIYSQINVVAITSTQDGEGVKLPTPAEGDYFELYGVNGHSLKFYDAAGVEQSFTNGMRRQVRYVSGAWRQFD